MASTSSLPTASAAVAKLLPSSSYSSSQTRRVAVSFPRSSKLKKPLIIPSKGLGILREPSVVAKAQLNEVVGGSSNDSAPSESKVEVPTSGENDVESGKQHSSSAPLSDEAISEFMTQVASLVKLVDSRDIVELQLKQLDCELIIRKKEALPQLPAPAPVVMMQSPSMPAAIPSPVSLPPPASSVPSPASASSAPAVAAASAPKALKSSHPPLKSPMSGTFYRSPGPGLAPFVKLGDKVNKGQVLCIIEAMKLMNEIEADQAGTVVEILVDDGKPVGVEQPMFVIEP
ncbi:biotin carboxyl carrier protein of acetyl-CoA carboxylase 1, chloroplastic-like [Typha angustifolia]|uniref:biotin carboxyl carrier protein of acetyl-CoA carboxylase 1, chloroplastic-like n=1 Tax=Typha angustifolia TaxID=59011 RepID=UPI003C2ED676